MKKIDNLCKDIATVIAGYLLQKGYIDQDKHNDLLYQYDHDNELDLSLAIEQHTKGQHRHANLEFLYKTLVHLRNAKTLEGLLDTVTRFYSTLDVLLSGNPSVATFGTDTIELAALTRGRIASAGSAITKTLLPQDYTMSEMGTLEALVRTHVYNKHAVDEITDQIETAIQSATDKQTAARLLAENVVLVKKYERQIVDTLVEASKDRQQSDEQLFDAYRRVKSLETELKQTHEHLVSKESQAALLMKMYVQKAKQEKTVLRNEVQAYKDFVALCVKFVDTTQETNRAVLEPELRLRQELIEQTQDVAKQLEELKKQGDLKELIEGDDSNELRKQIKNLATKCLRQYKSNERMSIENLRHYYGINANEYSDLIATPQQDKYTMVDIITEIYELYGAAIDNKLPKWMNGNCRELMVNYLSGSAKPTAQSEQMNAYLLMKSSPLFNAGVVDENAKAKVEASAATLSL